MDFPSAKEVERRALESVRLRTAELVNAYWERFGSEIGADNARSIVSPEYAASRENRTRYTEATQRPAHDFADYLFHAGLQNPNPEKLPFVIMTGGGTGAGKTSAIASNPDYADVQLVFDSNLGSKRPALGKIAAARTAGNQVRVVFVHRDPIEAFVRGVLPRAMLDGRIVGLVGHAHTFCDAAKNFRYLIRKYANDPDVAFSAIDNSVAGRPPSALSLEKAVTILYSVDELLPALSMVLESEYAAGRISEPVYRATLGAPPTGTSGSLPRNPL